jgi:phage-related protein
MAVFTYTPSYEPTEVSKPRIRKNETADGFAQRAVYGINADSKQWELVFSNRTSLEREAIASFLDAHSGAESFRWISPRGVVGTYICDDWQVTLSSCNNNQIRATFIEVQDIKESEFMVTQDNYLALNIEGLLDAYEPVNRDWAYYRLERNTSDEFENYVNGDNIGDFLFKKFDAFALASFNGTSQYFRTDLESTSRGFLSSAGTRDNSVLLWFRFTALPSTTKYLWIASNAAQTIYTGLRYNNTTQKLEYVRYSQGVANVVVVSQLSIQTNITYTTCCRYTSATGLQELFINNTLQNSVTSASTLAIAAGDNTRVTVGYSITEGYTAVNIGRFRLAGLVLTDIGRMMTIPTIQIFMGATVVSNSWIVIFSATTLGFTVPAGLTPKTYFVYALIGGVSNSPIQVRYINLPIRSTALSIRFDNSDVLTTYFDKMKRGWGGANGGVVPENVSIGPDNTGTTVLVMESHGDNYTGTVQGVNKFGDPKYNLDGSPWVKRVGAVIVSKDYFCFGRYEYEAKVVQVLGVASAFWHFHYQEIYPDDPRWNSYINDLGLRTSGDAENGFYIVRNNEIDIELPSHLLGGNIEDPSLSNGKFNTWRGELQNWDVAPGAPGYWEEYRDNYRALGFNAADNQYHTYRYDWYHDKVEFYVDNVLIVTNINNQFGYDSNNLPDVAGKVTIGPWFPSAAKKWAGINANFATEKMYVKSFKYTPFASEIANYQVFVGETYPGRVSSGSLDGG